MTHTTTDVAEARALDIARKAAALVFDERTKKAGHPATAGMERYYAKVIRAGEGDGFDAVQSALIAVRLATAEAASGAGERGTGKPDYEPAWREMYDALSWMHGCKALAGYAGWPLGKIATDLIDQAYPDLRDGTAATTGGDQAKYADMDMDERAVAMANDCAGDPWELLGYFREKLRQSEANAESARDAAVGFAQRRSGSDLGPQLREAICGVADDYQTSEQHHPNHVLIPLAKFEQLRAVAKELEAIHD